MKVRISLLWMHIPASNKNDLWRVPCFFRRVYGGLRLRLSGCRPRFIGCVLVCGTLFFAFLPLVSCSKSGFDGNTSGPYSGASPSGGVSASSGPEQTALVSGAPGIVYTPDPEGTTPSKQTLYFPMNTGGSGEYAQKVYAVEPFSITFKLPHGWYCLTRPKVPEMYLAARDGSDTGVGIVYSVYWIYDDSDVCVGAVGYDLFRPVSDDAGDEAGPDGIYYKINSDKDYRFTTDEYYFTVENEFDNVTALTQIFISAEWLKHYGVRKASDQMHVGLLSYDRECGAYVAFHLFPSTITSLELMELAESLRFVKAGRDA